MAVTIKQIAEMSGVSRGTVDRVLNNRGKVRPETEAIVRRFADQLGYKPNLAGQALAVRKKSPVIGVIVSSEGNQFFDEVLRGIDEATQELKDYGIRILLRTMKGYGVHDQLALMDELKEELHVLILNPINDPAVARKIDELTQGGVGVITMNNDIQNSSRLCYVGSDYRKGGETACGMMSLMTGGKAEIGVLTGSSKLLGHNQRVEGFRARMREAYPGMHIAAMAETNDDDVQAFEETKRLLRAHPEINALFIVAAGAYGVCRAVVSMGLQKELTVIGFDAIPSTLDMMKQGIVKATICQQPYTQGNRSVHVAFDYIVRGEKPAAERYIMKNEIKILENL